MGDWEVLITGERSAGFSRTGRESPPLMAVRDWGKGRVAVLADHSSHYWNDGYHLFYDNGWLLENGDTWDILLNALEWLAEPSIKVGSPKGGKYKAIPPLGAKGGIIIRPEEKFKDLKSFRGVFGVFTEFSGGIHSVDDFARKARELELDFIVVTDHIEGEREWAELAAACESASDASLVVIPGVAWKDSAGNLGYAANIEKWPPMKRDLDFIHTMLQTQGSEYQGIYVFAQPKLNPSRPWETGGMNALEVVTMLNGSPVSMAIDMWKGLQPFPGMTLLPVVSAQAWTLEQFERAAKGGFRFHLMARGLDSLRRTPVPSFIPGYVSSGPVLRKFEAEPFVSDTWESYVLWQTGDVVTVKIVIDSERSLSQVDLMSGSRLARRFYPNSSSFEAEVAIVMEVDGPFYLLATDDSGGRLFSYAIPTRNMNFWNHVGSDRMNDYHNPVCPDPQGEIVHNGKRYGFGGLVTLALGWGNYIRIYHPTPSARYHPQGYETGQINAGLDNLSTYPRLRVKGGPKDPVTPEGVIEPDRRQLLATRDVVIIEETFPRTRFTKGNGAFEYGLNRSIEAATRLVMFRYHYQPYGQIIIMGSSSVKLRTHCDLSIHKERDDQLAVEMLGLRFKGGGKGFKNLIHRDAEGVRREEAISFDGAGWRTRRIVGEGGYMTLAPDKFGLLGFHSVDGAMEVVVDSDGPSLTAGFDMAQGQLALRGQAFSARWIVTQDGGGENQELFEELSGLWGLGKGKKAPVYAPKEIESGSLLQEPYVVTIKAEDHGCVASFSSPSQLPNRILPVTVQGLRDGWSAGALRLDGLAPMWYPGGVLDGSLWIALEEDGRYFLGHPLVCDEPSIKLEITSVSQKVISFTLHNPESSSVTVAVGLVKILGDGVRKRFRLGPGATESSTIPLARHKRMWGE